MSGEHDSDIYEFYKLCTFCSHREDSKLTSFSVSNYGSFFRRQESFEEIYVKYIKQNRYELKNLDKINLTSEQENILKQIKNRMVEDSYLYINGATGTGKTLLILHLANEFAKNGKVIIFTKNLTLSKLLDSLIKNKMSNSNNIKCYAFYDFFRNILYDLSSLFFNISNSNYKFLDEQSYKKLRDGENSYVEVQEMPPNVIDDKKIYLSWDEFLKKRELLMDSGNNYPFNCYSPESNADPSLDLDALFSELNMSLVCKSLGDDFKIEESLFRKITTKINGEVVRNLRGKLKDDKKFSKFLKEEIDYLRSIGDYSKYLQVLRTGRVIPLSLPERNIMWFLCLDWHYWLLDGSVADEMKVVFDTYSILSWLGKHINEKEIKTIIDKYRAYYYLIDEAQDIPYICMKLLKEFFANDETKFIFAGDRRQKVSIYYNKISDLGFNFQGKIYSLKQNFRNTKAILRFAYEMIKDYNFSSDDEDNDLEIIEPEYSEYEGVKPLIIEVKNNSQVSEKDIILNNIKLRMKIINTIAVITENKELIESLKRELENTNIEKGVVSYIVTSEQIPQVQQLHENLLEFVIEFQKDTNCNDKLCKIFLSTLEAAKGFEFDCVILAGVSEDILNAETNDEKLKIAKKLYVAMTRARDELIITYSGTSCGVLSDFLKQNTNNQQQDDKLLEYKLFYFCRI